MSLTLHVISLRYSSWSIRALITLWHAGADPEVKTVELDLAHQGMPETIADHDAYVRDAADRLAARRALGSVTGSYPVLSVDGVQVHETLAISEWAAERYPDAGLWPADPLQRARARSLSTEMATGFANLRTHMSCHPFARVPGFRPDGPTRVEIARVCELLDTELQTSSGPFLFGDFGIVDAMYFVVLMRFETYGIALPPRIATYADALHGLPAVARWRQLAADAPRIPVYDAYIERIGGQVFDGPPQRG